MSPRRCSGASIWVGNPGQWLRCCDCHYGEIIPTTPVRQLRSVAS